MAEVHHSEHCGVGADPVAGMGRDVFGVFYELTSSLLLFFAMMVTMRYWYEATRWVESVMPGAGAYGAFGAYWAVFLLGCLPLILVLNRVTEEALLKRRRLLNSDPIYFIDICECDADLGLHESTYVNVMRIFANHLSYSLWKPPSCANCLRPSSPSPTWMTPCLPSSACVSTCSPAGINT